MDSRTDPVIHDLLRWLKDNLPPEADDKDIFKKVKRVQKVFDTLIGLSFEEFYNHALSLENSDQKPASGQSMEQNIDNKLEEIKDYLELNHQKQLRTKRLNASRSKLDLKKEQYQLIQSIQLGGCMDLITRYNHLISKK